MKFEFASAGRIVFGAGCARDAGQLVTAFGRQALIVTGQDSSRARWLVESIGSAGGTATLFAVPGEPTIGDAQAATARARAEHSDVIVGLGGGSALDTAKAVSALVTNQKDLFEYLEVIGRGQPLTATPLPCVAIPTTAGTGSEVTRNAVLASPEHRLKVSLRSPAMLPRLAIVDPELTVGLPRAVTAATGCDAMVQLIEPFLSSRANPLTDALCREGLARVARSLKAAADHGSNLAAREDMAIASLFGGIALANAGLGAVHGLASPIGGRFNAPHGAVCGILLASALEVNLAALQARHLSTVRFDEIAQLLTGRSNAHAADGIAWIRNLVGGLGLPKLGSYGIGAEDLGALSDAAQGTSSMKANSVKLTVTEVGQIIRLAL